MSDLLKKMQGAIYNAKLKEKSGFSGTIAWRTVADWMPLVRELELRSENAERALGTLRAVYEAEGGKEL